MLVSAQGQRDLETQRERERERETERQIREWVVFVVAFVTSWSISVLKTKRDAFVKKRNVKTKNNSLI